MTPLPAVQALCSLTPRSVLYFSAFFNTWLKSYSLYEAVSETSSHRQWVGCFVLVVGWLVFGCFAVVAVFETGF